MSSKPRRKSRKVRRVVLGVGYPWFGTTPGSRGVTFENVGLTGTPVSASILFRNWDWLQIDPKGLGNWNRIRLVAEVLK